MIISTSAIQNIKTRCPVCNAEWTEDQKIKAEMTTSNGGFKSAFSYDTCYRRCPNDGIAISNGKTPKLIFKNIENNIPEELLSCQDKLSVLLEECFNRKHKEAKRNQFMFYRSEDAFTWAYFGFICKNGLLAELQKSLELTSPIKDIMFWGTPYFSQSENELKNHLASVCDFYEEYESSRSEPDIIIVTESELVFIEVKVDSSNPELSESKKEKVLKYRNDSFYKDFEKSWRLSELARNWSIGNLMAQKTGKSFKLINLMPEKYVSIEKESELQKNFKAGLKNPEAYEIISWEKLFDAVDENYRNYLKNRMNSIIQMK